MYSTLTGLSTSLLFWHLQWNLRCKSHFQCISLERTDSAGPSNLPIPSLTFFEMHKKEHSLVQKYPSCCWAWECLCWEITGKINKTKSWQVSSWCSRRCDCEVIHHEWVRTVMSVNIDLLNQSLFSLSLSLSLSLDQLWRLLLHIWHLQMFFYIVINWIAVSFEQQSRPVAKQ